jgi:hypothetical protein
MVSNADELILPVPENDRREKHDGKDKGNVCLFGPEPGAVEKKDV